MNEKIEEYIALKAGMKAGQERIDELSPELLDFVLAANPEDKTVEIEGYGTFSVQSKKKYDFTGTEVEELENRAAILRKELIGRGEVKVDVTEFLKFVPVLSGGAVSDDV